ncbi:flagellar protein FliT [Lysinibacillus sp. FSL H8-0500]|uniref:Flagellar protein FliT n=1 Tax=Lysinibacillus macroides TaxID=33935 RepID=A0A0N0CVY6_9BACI|nr:flagellar protein FliT [Lysinibacillus macroides]KOY82381.1 flagellar assembly protein FliT [Lysinibacillus macroides]QPR66578.1 flagellar protein FliT [Lysinibacillus macroides]
MQPIEQLLQVSANLYKVLGDMPTSEGRDGYIERIHYLLDTRETIIEALMQTNFRFDEQDRTHCTLRELDNGIKERLVTVMSSIKQDLANLQKAKKKESQYYNPYSEVRTLDGMYYDKKN